MSLGPHVEFKNSPYHMPLRSPCLALYSIKRQPGSPLFLELCSKNTVIGCLYYKGINNWYFIYIYMSFYFRAAVACIGGLYEKLGRMVGRSYEETIALLIKGLKNAEVRPLFYHKS